MADNINEDDISIKKTFTIGLSIILILVISQFIITYSIERSITKEQNFLDVVDERVEFYENFMEANQSLELKIVSHILLDTPLYPSLADISNCKYTVPLDEVMNSETFMKMGKDAIGPNAQQIIEDLIKAHNEAHEIAARIMREPNRDTKLLYYRTGFLSITEKLQGVTNLIYDGLRNYYHKREEKLGAFQASIIRMRIIIASIMVAAGLFIIYTTIRNVYKSKAYKSIGDINKKSNILAKGDLIEGFKIMDGDKPDEIVRSKLN
ncbi:MAG: hypothetical protein FWG49_03960 [Leptospirales bacterium]|nr:hypothetical protein [Leptospirales bacterium]